MHTVLWQWTREQINDLVTDLWIPESSSESLGSSIPLISRCQWNNHKNKSLISDSFSFTYFCTMVSESNCELHQYLVHQSAVITITLVLMKFSSSRKLERHTVELIKSNNFSRVVSTLTHSDATMEVWNVLIMTNTTERRKRESEVERYVRSRITGNREGTRSPDRLKVLWPCW